MIVVTGASRGLGAAIKQHLESTGHDVVGIATTAKSDERIYAADIGDWTSISRTADRIRSECGDVSALVNAAGVGAAGLTIAMRPETVEHIVVTNLIGTIFTNQLFAKQVIRRGGGRIINFSSLGVVTAAKGLSVYVASKAGVEGFTRSFAREVAAFDITVNCIAPGPMRTDMHRSSSDADLKTWAAPQIFTAVQSDSDVCNFVDLLLSPEAAHLTGQVLHVGGA